MSRFHAASAALLLTLSACDTTWVSDGPAATAPAWGDAREVPPPVLSGCEAVRAESAWCLSVDVVGGGPVVMGLDSGDVCDLWPDAGPAGLTDVRTLATSGDDLLACAATTGALGRWSLDDGSVMTVPGACGAVSGSVDGLIAIADPDCVDGGCDSVDLYGSVEELIARTSTDSWEMDGIRGLALATHGELLLSATEGSVDLFDLRTGALLGAQPLQDSAGPIKGLSPSGRGELAVLVGDYVVLHDPTNGERLGEIRVSFAGGHRELGGLDCHR